MKKLLTFIGLLLVLSPHSVFAMTDAEAKHQLALEASNLATFGNPFGKSGKFEELYDPTGKPWWMVQLAKEAWSEEMYGNPFGYPIAQKVLTAPKNYVAPAIQDQPVRSSGVSGNLPSAPSVNPASTLPSLPQPVTVTPHFLAAPYLTDNFYGDVSDAERAQGVVGVAVHWSQPLPDNGSTPSSYLLFCVNPSYPKGVRIETQNLQGENGRLAIVTKAFGPGRYTCKFTFTEPVAADSESVEFDMP